MIVYCVPARISDRTLPIVFAFDRSELFLTFRIAIVLNSIRWVPRTIRISMSFCNLTSHLSLRSLSFQNFKEPSKYTPSHLHPPPQTPYLSTPPHPFTRTYSSRPLSPPSFPFAFKTNTNPNPSHSCAPLDGDCTFFPKHLRCDLGCGGCGMWDGCLAGMGKGGWW
jgi:hypothetical protein